MTAPAGPSAAQDLLGLGFGAAPAAHVAGAGEEEKKQSRKRYDHLRQIEVKMQEVQLANGR